MSGLHFSRKGPDLHDFSRRFQTGIGSHLYNSPIEEAGEFLAAAGKTQRWGRLSSNPELPPHERENNEDWLMREMGDLEGALQRLWDALGGRQT